MTLNEQTKTATIKVSGLAAKTHLQLVYATARGQVLGEALVNADGTQQFEVDQLVGFEQNLKVVVKENENQNDFKRVESTCCDTNTNTATIGEYAYKTRMELGCSHLSCACCK